MEQLPAAPGDAVRPPTALRWQRLNEAVALQARQDDVQRAWPQLHRAEFPDVGLDGVPVFRPGGKRDQHQERAVTQEGARRTTQCYYSEMRCMGNRNTALMLPGMSTRYSHYSPRSSGTGVRPGRRPEARSATRRAARRASRGCIAARRPSRRTTPAAAAVRAV